MNDTNDLKENILNTALQHAIFDGWSWRALNSAAYDLGIEHFTLKRYFPDGPRDLVVAFNTRGDRLMADELIHLGIEELPVRERITTAVQVRLEQNKENKELIRRLLSFLALPANSLLGLKCTYETVNTMWYSAGDQSTDFNFYSKRMLLGAVYSSTVLYWLSDVSDDSSETFEFLDRRIADVMRIPSATAALKNRFSTIWPIKR